MIILPDERADAFSRIRRQHRMPEAAALEGLRARQPKTGGAIEATALRLPPRVGATPPRPVTTESFLRHYCLSTPQGGGVMCLAQAALRLPQPAPPHRPRAPQ